MVNGSIAFIKIYKSAVVLDSQRGRQKGGFGKLWEIMGGIRSLWRALGGFGKLEQYFSLPLFAFLIKLIGSMR
jgi:hypothetical protein